jgi:hypothetical protein
MPRKQTKQEEPADNRTSSVILPAGVYQEGMVVYRVTGAALCEYGADDGDLILVKPASRLNENLITVWETPTGTKAMFAYENFGDVTLYNPHADSQIRYKAKEVKLIGEAVQALRNLTTLTGPKKVEKSPCTHCDS